MAIESSVSRLKDGAFPGRAVFPAKKTLSRNDNLMKKKKIRKRKFCFRRCSERPCFRSNLMPIDECKLLVIKADLEVSFLSMGHVKDRRVSTLLAKKMVGEKSFETSCRPCKALVHKKLTKHLLQRSCNT